MSDFLKRELDKVYSHFSLQILESSLYNIIMFVCWCLCLTPAAGLPDSNQQHLKTMSG